MATVQTLLDDINLRYRNTFSTDQKLVWMNEEQRELFEIIELDSVPFSFSTVKGQYLYPIPLGVEKDRIKVMTIQNNTVKPNTKVTPDYVEMPFRENDNNQFVSEFRLWYTIVENNFYINYPGGPQDNRTVYIYLDQQPEAMSSANLNVEPAVPVRHQELLKLGTLKRIAAARKDVDMYNNYNADYIDKITRLKKKMALQQPEYHKTIDMMPSRRRSRVGGARGVDRSLFPF